MLQKINSYRNKYIHYIYKSNLGDILVSRKIGDFMVFMDTSINVNEVKLHGSFFERGGELNNGPRIIKVMTKYNKKIFLNAISGSQHKSEANMHLDLMKRLNITENERILIVTLGIIDFAIKILMNANIAKIFQIGTAILGILLVIFLIKIPFHYVLMIVFFFFIAFIFLIILSYILKHIYLKEF